MNYLVACKRSRNRDYMYLITNQEIG